MALRWMDVHVPLLDICYYIYTVDNIAIDQKKRPYARCRKMEFAQLFVAG